MAERRDLQACSPAGVSDRRADFCVRDRQFIAQILGIKINIDI
jgi:hypothetical protein